MIYNILDMMNNRYIYLLSCFLIGLQLSCSTKKVIDPSTHVMSLKEKHEKSFSIDVDGPMDKENIKYLDYFDVDGDWVLTCDCDTTIKTPIVTVGTSSGKSKSYQPWALATCKHKGKSFSIYMYLQVPRAIHPLYKNNYFILFKDATNGESTYAGGRYIDGQVAEVKDNKVTIDFNQAYNPYCAYSTGYNCPIPPSENHLDIPITAGEKAYKGPIKKK